MASIVESIEAVEAFLETGGSVLSAIFVVTFVLWVLIAERYMYLRWTFPKEESEILRGWWARDDRQSWYAEQDRRRRLSTARQRLNASLSIIQTLIALCPLLGLLGTVTGMIEVFDVMAMVGSANPRAMASGVSRATIPTMAGMVAALSGVYLSVTLTRAAAARTQRLAEKLSRD